MNILIAGFGNIGKHMLEELKSLTPDIYDPNITEYKLEQNKKYDVAFICVPTDCLPDGSCDTSIVEQAVRETDADILVIKSTVPPGTTDKLIKATDKNIIFSPEHYGTTQHCKADPGFVVLGGDKQLTEKAAQIYFKAKNGYYKIFFTDTLTAELSKYMLNSFLALKVTFCNEFADFAKKFGVSYPELRELFVADERVGHSHTFVYPEKPYYDSHCFNKDVPALIKFADNAAPLMKCVDKLNSSRKYENSLKIRAETLRTLGQTDFKYYCSICLIIRDENEYLEEWLNWHIGQGIKHFYIYDHGSKYSVEQFIQAFDDKIADKVTVIDWSGSHENAQPKAYNDCLKRFGNESKWIGFIDADEHVRVNTGQSLPEFLKHYEDYAGVFAIWVMYGANGQKEKTKLPLRQRFSQMISVKTWADKMGKVFVQPERMKDMYIHNGHPACGYDVVGEWKDIVPEAQIWKDNPTTDLICVDHYFTKSYEEWVEKLKRGRCHAFNRRRYAEFFELNPDMEYCRENIRLAQGYAISRKTVSES